MKGQRTRRLRYLAVCVSTIAFLLGIGAASAQGSDAPSQNMTINLIRLLVKQKVITQKNADELLKEAERETAQARTAKVASLPVPAARPEPPPPAPGVLRVPYVPEIVKNQIRDEVKAEVIKQAKAENWAQPEALPAWTRRITLNGDIRIRDEADLYGKNNIGSDGLDGYVNYAAFNANGPTDVNPNTILSNIPFLNTTQNRYNQASIRARVGLTADVADGVLVGFRLGTGQSNSPVSTTQLLGGGFDKNDIWLDQLYVSLAPGPFFDLTLGRMPNPFFHTDLVYDDNLNFDGVAAHSHFQLKGGSGLGFFSTYGAFPIGYVDANFPTYSPTKAADRTEWLLGAQTGVDWARRWFDWRTAVSVYDYINSQGALSAPCPIYLGTKQCSTDDTVPAFMQKGNTLFLVRNIIPDPSNPTNYAQPQFAALMMRYSELDATTSFDWKMSDSHHLILDGDFVRNLAYDTNDALRYAALGVYPVTNYNSATNAFQSGPDAYMGRIEYGNPVPRALWDWNIIAGYKYIEPDAILDAFDDHDFNMGGTNARGYFVKASLGVFDNTWVSAKWYSSNQIWGPPLAIDVLQVELNAVY